MCCRCVETARPSSKLQTVGDRFRHSDSITKKQLIISKLEQSAAAVLQQQYVHRSRMQHCLLEWTRINQKRPASNSPQPPLGYAEHMHLQRIGKQTSLPRAHSFLRKREERALPYVPVEQLSCDLTANASVGTERRYEFGRSIHGIPDRP
eukprot:6202587-Pleurochrysis_carterae.AAC.1